MATRKQLRDKIESAHASLAALDGHLEMTEADKTLRGYASEIANVLDELRTATADLERVQGVPKIEFPLALWESIEGLAGGESAVVDPRKRARAVIQWLERNQETIRAQHQTLAQHGLALDPPK